MLFLVCYYGWLIRTEFCFERDYSQIQRSSQHLLPPEILNDLCLPFNYFRHKQIISVLTLVRAAFISLLQKRIHNPSIQYLLCVMQSLVPVSMSETRRSKMWSVPLGTSLWEEMAHMQDTFTLPWEQCPWIHWAYSHRHRRDNHLGPCSLLPGDANSDLNINRTGICWGSTGQS